MSSMQVFISYAHEDTELAQRLYRDLRNAGVNPWLDEQSIKVGQRWEPEIRKAMKDSRYFIPLLSRNSVEKKGYVRREINDALDIMDEIRKSDTYMLPVRLDEVEVTDRRLARVHFADLFRDWNRGVEKILEAIKTGGPPLSPASKRAMRASQIALGVIAMIFSIVIFASELGWVGLTESGLIYKILLALAILGIERLITGIFGVGKGRKAILSLGIVVLTLTGLGLFSSYISYIYETTYEPIITIPIGVALLIDGPGRIYFGIRNKTTSTWSRKLSIVTGIIEIISAMLILNAPFLGSPLSLFVSLAVVIVGVQMLAAGIAGRRLTITT